MFSLGVFLTREVTVLSFGVCLTRETTGLSFDYIIRTIYLFFNLLSSIYLLIFFLSLD